MRGPDGLDTRALAAAALRQGILVEPGDVFFLGDDGPRHFFRLGFSAIAVDRIEPGIRALSRLVARLV